MDHLPGVSPPGKKDFHKSARQHDVGRRHDGSLVEPVSPDPRIPKGEALEGKPLLNREVNSLPFAIPVLPRPKASTALSRLLPPAASSHEQVQAWLKSKEQITPLEVSQALARHGHRIEDRLKLISSAVEQRRGIDVLRARGQLPGFSPPVTADYVLAVAIMLYQIGAQQVEVQAQIKANRTSEQAWLVGIREFNHLQNLRKELDRSVGHFFSTQPVSQPVVDPDTGQLPPGQDDSDPPDELLIDLNSDTGSGAAPAPELPKPKAPTPDVDLLTGQWERGPVPERVVGEELHRDVRVLQQKLDHVTRLVEGQNERLSGALLQERNAHDKVVQIQRTVTEQQASIRALEGECSELRQALQTAEQGLAKQLGKKDRATDLINDLKTRLAQKETELAHQTEVHSRAVTDLQSRLESLEAVRQETQSGFDELQAKARGLNLEKRQLQARLDTSNNALLRVNAKQVGTLDELKSRDAQLASLRQVVSQLEESARSLQESLANVRGKLEESQQSYQQLTRYFGRTFGELSEAKKSGSLAIQRLEHARQDLKKAQNERALFQEGLKVKSKQLAEALEEAKSVQSKLEQAGHEVTLQQKQIEQAEEEKGRLSKNIQHLQREVTRGEESSKQDRERLDRLNADLRDREQSVVRLCTKQSETVQQLTKAEKHWIEAEREITELKKTLGELEVALLKKDHELARVHERLGSEWKESSLREQHLKEIIRYEKAVADHFHSLADTLGHKCRQLEEKNAGYRQQLTALQPRQVPEDQVSLQYDDLLLLKQKEMEGELSESLEREKELKSLLTTTQTEVSKTVASQQDTVKQLADLTEEKESVEIQLKDLREQRGRELPHHLEHHKTRVRLEREHQQLKEESEAQRISLESQLKGSQQSEEKLRNELNEKEKSVSELKSQMAQMESRLRAELEKSESKLRATEQERDGLKDSLKEQRATFESELSQTKGKVKELEESVSSVTAEKESYLSEVGQLKREKEELDRKTLTMQQEVDAVQSKLDKILDELSSLRTPVAAIQREQEPVNVEFTAVQNNYTLVLVQINELRHEYEEKRTATEDLSQELADIKQQLAEKTQELSDHDQEASKKQKEAQSKIETLETAVVESKKELSSSSSALASKEKEFTELKAKLETQEDSFGQEQALKAERIKVLELEKTSLEQQRDESASAIAKQSIKLAGIEVRRQNAVARNFLLATKMSMAERRHNRQLEELAQEKDDLLEQVRNLESELQEKEENLKTGHETLGKVQEQYFVANHDLKALQARYAELESSSGSASGLASLESQVEAKDTELSGLQATVEKLSETLEKKSHELSDLKSERDSLQSTVDNQRRKIEEQEELVKEGREEIESSKRSLEDVNSQLEEDREAHSDYEEIKKKLQWFEDKCNKLRDKYQKAFIDFEWALKSRKKASEKISVLVGRIKYLAEKVRDLEKSKATDHGKLQASLTVLEVEKKALTRQLSELRGRVPDLESVKQKAAMEAETLKSELGHLEVEYTTQVGIIQSQSSEAKVQLAKLEREHKETAQTVESLRENESALKDELSTSKQEVARLETELAKEKGKVTEEAATKLAASRELEEKRLQVIELTGKVASAQAEKKEVESHVATVSAELEKLKATHLTMVAIEAEHTGDTPDSDEKTEEPEALSRKRKRKPRDKTRRKRRSSTRSSSRESGFLSDGSSSSRSSIRATMRDRAGKHSFIRESEMRERINMLAQTDMGGTGVGLTLLHNQMVARVRKAESELYHELGALDKQDLDSFPVDLLTPPSLEKNRKAKIECCDTFSDLLLEEIENFENSIEGDEGAGKDVVKSLEELRVSVEELAYGLEDESEEFLEYKDVIEEADWITGGESPSHKEAVWSALASLRTVLETPGIMSDEQRAFAVGVMSKEMHELFTSSGKDALLAAGDDSDQKLLELERQRQALQRLLPERLPLDMASQIPPIGRKYLSKIVTETIGVLEASIQPPLTDETDDRDPRGVSGKVLARKLIHNAEICPSVVALLGSLQGKHEGHSKTDDEYEYFQASSAGLKRIRDDHGLVDMPTMRELLEACEEDLGRTDSLLVAEAARQHHGKARRTKMQLRCKGLLEGEKSKPEKENRNQCTIGGEKIATHPHRTVLNCFVDGAEGDVVRRGTKVVRQEPYCSYTLPSDREGLFNNFFEGAGDAVLRENIKTGDQYLQLEGCTPGDIVFKSKGAAWRVDLDQTTWSVHPAFLLDHPNFTVPFEADDHGKLHRDWLPLRDSAGNTALLVLRKTPGHLRYFLYEMGEKGALLPRMIGPDYNAEERQNAELLCQAARVSADGGAKVVSPKGAVPLEVQRLRGSERNWLKPSVEQLNAIHVKIRSGSGHEPVAPLKCSPPSLRLDAQKIKLNTLREVTKAKDAPGKAELVTVVGGEDQGLFAHFSVDPAFDMTAKVSLQEKMIRYGEQSPLVKGLKADQQQFRTEAFGELTTYSGCELKPGRPGGPIDQESPAAVLVNLEKVIKINRSHCMRANQSCSVLKSKILENIRTSHPELAKYTDREVLEQAMREFEVGNIPQVADQQVYIRRMTDLMMLENDLLQSSRIGQQLQGLKRKVQTLEADCHIVKEPDEVARYQVRCQQCNLDVALTATHQKLVNDRLNHYGDQVLDTETLAMLSFERRMGAVLRANQVQEVKSALAEVTQAMETGGQMSRISHKGTGWGKSTILQLLTDHASQLAKGRPDLSVLVVAPESNQAELDIMLGRYYAKKGRTYRRLNMVEELKADSPPTAATLDRVHNILLGLDPATNPEGRKVSLMKGRAPVGVSIKDVQILMHMRNAYLAHGTEPVLTEKMDGIMDLLRESMAFCDEWDSALVPHLKTGLATMAEEINEALKLTLLNYPITPDDIIRCQGEFILGSRRKQLLSATTATPYTAAKASGSVSPSVVKTRCNTDPLTTNQRFWHWMSSAEPAYFRSGGGRGRGDLVEKVIDRVGTECQVMMFDGRDKAENLPDSVRAVHDELTAAREKRGGKTKATLFYDKDKNMKQYQPDGQMDDDEASSDVSVEDEAFLRKTGGASADVYLTQRESVGTDAPQGQKSAGIYLGLFEQEEEGREDLIAQQVGRLMRASNELRKPQQLFFAVDLDAFDKKDAENSEFFAAQNRMDEAMQAFRGKLESPQLVALGESLLRAPLRINPLLPGSTPEEFEQSVDVELERLSTTDWARSGLDADAITLLREYKKSEWQSKKALLELTAKRLERRESNDHTHRCEVLLEEAGVSSFLEAEAAAEDVWLNSAAESIRRTFKLPASVGELHTDHRFGDAVEQNFQKTAEANVKSIQRRDVRGATKVESIPGHLNSEWMVSKIESQMQAIRLSGLEVEQDKGFVREMDAFRAECIGTLEDAVDRVEGIERVLSQVKSPECYGLKELRDYRARTEAKIEALRTGTQDEILAEGQAVEAVYEEFLMRVLNVAFDEVSHDNKSVEVAVSLINKQLEEVFEFSEYALSTSITNKKAFSEIVKSTKIRLPLQGNVKKLSLAKKSPRLRNTKVTTLPLQNKALICADQKENMLERTKRLKKEKSWRDEVEKFCKSPKKEAFKKAVDEIEQELLESHKAFAEKQKPRVERKVAEMQQQREMMQLEMRFSEIERKQKVLGGIRNTELKEKVKRKEVEWAEKERAEKKQKESLKKEKVLRKTEVEQEALRDGMHKELVEAVRSKAIERKQKELKKEMEEKLVEEVSRKEQKLLEQVMHKDLLAKQKEKDDEKKKKD